MKLVIIVGPPAVGKMTVGQELAKLTDLRLFHNHMSIELVHHFFDFGTPSFSKLVDAIRFGIFEEVAKSELEGLIFTLVWAFDYKEDEIYVDRIINVFKAADAQVCLVELSTSLAVRLDRNKDDHRLAHKASKRDTDRSEKVLLQDEKQYRMNSAENEFPDKEILKIDNTDLPAAMVAQKIKDHFSL
jgi:adenylate kinase family enzyme